MSQTGPLPFHLAIHCPGRKRGELVLTSIPSEALPTFSTQIVTKHNIGLTESLILGRRGELLVLADCTNRHSVCDTWAAKGECELYPTVP